MCTKCVYCVLSVFNVCTECVYQVYRIAGKIGEVLNLAIWLSRIKSPNYIPPILEILRHRLAGYSSTGYIILYAVPALQDICILPRECDVGDSSLSLSLSLSPEKKFVSLTRV